jgi:hypothetical protein
VVARGRRGASTTGCLLSLLVFVAVLYYGVHIGEVYFRYYSLLDEMQQQSHLAAVLDDGTIQRRIVAKVQEIGLSDEAATNVRIQRTAMPRQIVIETTYSESVRLPLFNHTFNFHPQAIQPL